MKYKLTVIKYEKNENYESEIAKWKERTTSYGYSKMNMDELHRQEPQEQTATRSLEVFLTEEEYQAVKNGVITVFK